MSSLYGMAELDVRGFKDKCVEAGLGNVLLYIGGILGVGKHDFKDDEVKFKQLGFDRVYPPEADLKGGHRRSVDRSGKQRGNVRDRYAGGVRFLRQQPLGQQPLLNPGQNKTAGNFHKTTTVK